MLDGPTFAEFNVWETTANQQLTESKAKGIDLIPIIIDPDEFLKFCKEKGIFPTPKRGRSSPSLVGVTSNGGHRWAFSRLRNARSNCGLSTGLNRSLGPAPANFPGWRKPGAMKLGFLSSNKFSLQARNLNVRKNGHMGFGSVGKNC